MMLSTNEYKSCVGILQQELILALGCTEPSAVAYCAALAVQVLGEFPSRIELACSGNIIKNVNSVNVPNSGRLKGASAAAILGAVGGDASLGLEALQTVEPKDIIKAQALLNQNFCQFTHLESESVLHILVKAICENAWVEIEIKDAHTQVTRICKNGIDIEPSLVNIAEVNAKQKRYDKQFLNVRLVIAFANQICLEDVSQQISMILKLNGDIVNEGLRGTYGVSVGKTILKCGDVNCKTLCIAAAAAGSDARMGGCTYPVVVNSGSGNQGIAIDAPIIIHAKEHNCTEEQLHRALVLANLLSIYQKTHIGSLSAFCGATSAACSAVCGIAYLDGYGEEVISNIIINTLATIGGMICDGAKASCAMKIVAALQTAFLAYELAKEGTVYQLGEGIVGNTADQTIQNVGRVARNGMRSTDREILNIILEA